MYLSSYGLLRLVIVINLLQIEVCAAIAQLGERQTEDLKVPGSIPGRGNLLYVIDMFTEQIV